MAKSNERFMKKGVMLASVLALGALHCGGSSNRGSNMPEGSASEPGMSEPGVSAAEPTPGVGMGQDPADAERAGTQFERNPNDASSTDTLYAGSTPLKDPEIAAVVEQVNDAEIEQARLAQAQSQNPEVRRFAQTMLEHHGRALSEQRALGLGSAESPLSQQLEQKSAATLATLKGKTGADFDRAYLQAQVEAHQQALQTLRQLQPNARDAELRSYLDQLVPRVEEHLGQARAAQQALESRGTSGTSSRQGTTGMR